MTERERDEDGRRYLTAEDLLSRPEGVPSVMDVIEGRGSENDALRLENTALRFNLTMGRWARRFDGLASRFTDAAVRPLLEEKEAKRRGGENSKKLPCEAIQEVTDKLVRKNPTATGPEVWRLFCGPEEPHHVETWTADWKVYRDGSRLVQVDENGNERDIGERAFERYFTKAREDLPQS